MMNRAKLDAKLADLQNARKGYFIGALMTTIAAFVVGGLAISNGRPFVIVSDVVIFFTVGMQWLLYMGAKTSIDILTIVRDVTAEPNDAESSAKT